MYVCVCNAVTDHDIKEAIHAGAEDLEQIQRELGVSTGCGTCMQFAQEVIDQAKVDRLTYAA